MAGSRRVRPNALSEPPAGGGRSVSGAAFALYHGALNDQGLLAAFPHDPLMTLKVMAGIHWEAFRL